MSMNVHVDVLDVFSFVCMQWDLYARLSERREREVDRTIPRWLKVLKAQNGVCHLFSSATLVPCLPAC